MTSELRPAVEVWREASDAATLGSVKYKPAADQAAAAVIEADREAVRAEVARAIEVELSMCAIANVEAPSEWIDGFEFAWKRVKEALRQYKEATNV